MSAPNPLLHEVNVFKQVILSGLNAILPVFAQTFTDEMGQPFTIQMRGAYSTERRRAPNIVVSYQPGQARFGVGQNLIDIDPIPGLYLYGFYATDGQLRYTIQARNELERQWLIDSLALATTGIVYVDPITGAQANNAFVDYLLTQGIIVLGWASVETPAPVESDSASPRPEGQMWEATFPLAVDVSLQYLMPGVSVSNATLIVSRDLNPANNAVPAGLPWQPMPSQDVPLILSTL